MMGRRGGSVALTWKEVGRGDGEHGVFGDLVSLVRSLGRAGSFITHTTGLHPSLGLRSHVHRLQ